MYHIIMSRKEERYDPPKYGFRFTKTGGQYSLREKWILKSFESLDEAQKELDRIDEWFHIDGLLRAWMHTVGFCYTGTGRATNVVRNENSIWYEAYIDNDF